MFARTTLLEYERKCLTAEIPEKGLEVFPGGQGEMRANGCKGDGRSAKGKEQCRTSSLFFWVYSSQILNNAPALVGRLK